MYQIIFSASVFIVSSTLISIKPIALADSPNTIAEAITVEIQSGDSNKKWSGVLLEHQGKTYTVATTNFNLNDSSVLTVKTVDGKIHSSLPGSIQENKNNSDFCIFKFTSPQIYQLATIGDSNKIERTDQIYVSGFVKPTYAVKAEVFNFTDGEFIGKSSSGNKNNYFLIYTNTTLDGMNGGSVLNKNGELVAIHSQNSNTGRSMGITIEQLEILTSKARKKPNQEQRYSADQYFSMGYDQSEKGNYQKALANYNIAIKLDPKHIASYYNRGVLRSEKFNDFKGALTDYDKVILLNPKSSYAYYNRSVIKYQNLDNTLGSLSDLNKFIEVLPENPIGYYAQANILYSLGKKDSSIINFQKVLDLNSNEQIKLISQSVIYTEKGLFLESIKTLNLLLQENLDSENANLYKYRGLAYQQLGDKVNAIKDWEYSAILYRKNKAQKDYKIILSWLTKMR
jgi:tetratricopeptide (TPR) repeat protein